MPKRENDKYWAEMSAYFETHTPDAVCHYSPDRPLDMDDLDDIFAGRPLLAKRSTVRDAQNRASD